MAVMSVPFIRGLVDGNGGSLPFPRDKRVIFYCHCGQKLFLTSYLTNCECDGCLSFYMMAMDYDEENWSLYAHYSTHRGVHVYKVGFTVEYWRDYEDDKEFEDVLPF